jgi:hypothetical protein
MKNARLQRSMDKTLVEKSRVHYGAESGENYLYAEAKQSGT